MEKQGTKVTAKVLSDFYNNKAMASSGYTCQYCAHVVEDNHGVIVAIS